MFVAKENWTGGSHLHVLRSGNTTATGIPVEATNIDVAPATAERALVTYSVGSGTAVKRFVALLDPATATVDETHELPAAAKGNVAVSGTHLAWVEYGANNEASVVVVDRATGERKATEVGNAWRRDIEVELIGDWVTYGARSGLTDIEQNPLHALTARNIKDGTTVNLLTHAISADTAPDGTLVVRGGTVAQGEGLFRIALGAEGGPVVTLVASSGEPTKVALLSSKVPAVIDLDLNGGSAPLEFTLSRYNVQAKVTLRHARTGKFTVAHFTQPPNGVVRFDWISELNNGGFTPESAYNGDYTWEISAEPMNGIGPALSESGTFKVTRTAAPHDYNDNGSPDVLMRDTAGNFWRADTHYDALNKQLRPAERKLLGGGWNIFNQIEAAGNISGSTAGDLVARDASGVLWLYQGRGDGTFAARTKIGAGWQIYNKIAAGSDLNSDGKADLLATDTAGGLYLYKGTGNAASPYAARVKVGTGWGIFNQLTAVGNIAGSAAGDLVARDASGVLWLYQGRGDGTFAARTKIGAGWNTYTHLVGVGDANRDGRPDLYAYGANGTYLYKGTGSASAPFGARERTGVPDTAPLSHTSVV
ncbi:FG-GAP repeat domain-containing protein [Streptomyces sp. NPDC001927]